MKEQIRDNNIGTIHLLAAFGVMYGHQFTLVQQGVPGSLGCGAHILGVKVIMLLSGYLITKSLWSSASSKGKASALYFKKRLLRIYPELIFVLAVSAFIFGTAFTTLPKSTYVFDETTWRYVLNNVILKTTYILPGVFAENPYPMAVNGSLWTIPVEIFMYFGIWIIYLIPGEKLKKWAYILVTIVSATLMIVRIEYYPLATLVIHNIDWLQGLNIIPYFLVGGCFYLVDMKKYLKVQWALIIAVVFSMVKFPNALVIELFELIAISYIVMSLAFSEKQELRFPGLKSEYAYGVYLWGFVVQQCVVNICNVKLGLALSAGVLFLISAVVTYVLASLSYRYIYMTIKRICGD